MVTVYLGVGSNLGNREKNIKKAIEKIKSEKGIKVKKISTLYESEPVGGPAQGKFLNGAIEIETELLPSKLLGRLKQLEKLLGREKTVRYGPRIIDLDILLYGNKRVNRRDLKIPHPRMWEREFVLKPLRELMQHHEGN